MPKIRQNRSLVLKTIVVLLVFGATILVYRMATLDTEVEMAVTFELPDFLSIDLENESDTKRAVAVDGIVLQGDTSENTTRMLPIASTAKMIVALMVMEKKPFELGESGETLVISQEDYRDYIWYTQNNGSVTAVEVGEEISEKDALTAMLLASSNNMADTLARWAFSSIDAYREYAKQRLISWGITSIEIGDDASGYGASTVGTAADLAIIGQKVLQNPVLAEIVSRQSAVVPVAGTIENTNKILGVNRISGIKTGYNGISGYCLVTGYLEGEHIITAAILGEDTRQNSFDNMLKLISSAQEQLKEQVVVSDGEELGYYNSWWMGKTPIVASETLNTIAWNEDGNVYNLDMSGAGGTLKIRLNGREYSVNASAQNLVSEPSLWQRFLRVFGWEM